MLFVLHEYQIKLVPVASSSVLNVGEDVSVGFLESLCVEVGAEEFVVSCEFKHPFLSFKEVL
jgi:hypothetical protein